jgi:hydrogenase maturation factor
MDREEAEKTLEIFQEMLDLENAGA